MSDSWVGGDLAGLQAIGTTTAPARDAVDDVVRALSAKVDSLAADAGWSGDAADAFRKTWSENAIQAGGLAEVVVGVGKTLGDLGTTLQKIEDALYDAATEAARRGAQIGPRGVPATLVVTGDPSAPAAATAIAAQSDYAATYAQAMQTAQGYRLQAADALSVLAAEVEPGEGLKPGDALTVADYLRGLYAIPNEGNSAARAALPGQVGDAQDTLRQARKDLRAEKALYEAKNLHVPSSNPAALAHSAAVRDIAGLRDGLRAAESGAGELPLSRALNTKLGDLAGLLPNLGRALPEGLGFLRDIPVVDVVASGAIAELQAQDDMDKGWSGTEAHLKDYGAAALGLAAGAAVVVSLPADAVAAAAVLGGIAVVGVGDVAYQAFHEHWSEDIHDDGVVMGVLDGSGHVLSNVGSDVKGMATDVGHAASSVWHGVFG